MTCKHCNRDFCFLSNFEEDYGSTFSGYYLNTNPECLARLNFDFKITKDGEKGLIWGNNYRITASVSDNVGKERTYHLRSDPESWNDDDFFLRSSADKALNKFVTKLNQQRNLGLAKLQTNITNPQDKEILTNAQPTPDQISELIKKELDKVDLAKYLAQLEALTGKNQENINTLAISPAEHAQALARLQAIQAELERRKKVVQQLAQQKITEQLTEQKHQLEIVQKQIQAKAEEVESAKQAGQTVQAKQLNEEYNELRRKQAAVTALIINLEENVAYRTFVKFESLSDLYNPNHSLTNTSQVTVIETPLSWSEKALPYVMWGLGILLVVGLLYALYRFFFKELD